VLVENNWELDTHLNQNNSTWEN